ncbi:hemolysin family protein [Fictibacillus sp. Mic-4]|uniref:hemolysin family protein n=1 Tax=Fictibacillus TaxID=1329200 RepID=UPI0003FFEA4C|nr:hemolysin family protein [Fictibacillus gelatini]
MEFYNIIIVILLIVITAFFVASEFAIVRARRTRIEQLAEQGNKDAIAAKKIIGNLDGYLSATQLGITMTSLGLGWLGEPTVKAIIDPIIKLFRVPHALENTISFIISFALITFIHVVLGELAPKTFAIQKAESILLSVSRPLIIFNYVLFPFIYLLNGSANLFSRMFGVKPANENEKVVTEEELRLILSESFEGGEINQSEYRYMNKIFEFDDRTAKEIMVPRTEIVCLYTQNSFKENMEIMRAEKFTRYPVADGDKDRLIGLVNIKQFFNEHVTETEGDLNDYIHPIITVHESIPIQRLLVKMQKDRVHMAVLMDEYGGTAGIVTAEDILEEIVGEIRDEFDEDEQPRIQKLSPTKVVLDGKVLISEVNNLFGLDIDDTDLDTIGGWILFQTVDVAEGTMIDYEDYRFTISEVDGHTVKKVEVEAIKKESSS